MSGDLVGIPRSQLTDGDWRQLPNGNYVPAIPEPFYWGLFPWLRRRLTGYRDAENRKAQFIGWREGIFASLFETW